MKKLSETKAFYGSKGELSRLQFLINFLIIGGIFGASFSLLSIDSGQLVTMLWGIKDKLSQLGFELHSAIFLFIFGVFMTLISGLTSLWFAFLFTVILIVGSLVNTLQLHATSYNPPLIVAVAMGFIMSYMLCLAYRNVERRLRDMFGAEKPIARWCMIICALSIIPVVGLVLFMFLIFTPSLNSGQAFSRRKPLLFAGIFIVFLFAAGPSMLKVIFKEHLVISDLEDARRDPHRVHNLNLTKYRLDVLPLDVFQLTNLKSLNVSLVGIRSLPPEVGKLKELKELYLASNKLTTLPSEIGQLMNLKWLNLDNNNLSTLPPEIGDLTSLETLILKRNPLKSIPKELKNLANLKNFCYDTAAMTEEERNKAAQLLPGVSCH